MIPGQPPGAAKRWVLPRYAGSTWPSKKVCTSWGDWSGAHSPEAGQWVPVEADGAWRALSNAMRFIVECHPWWSKKVSSKARKRPGPNGRMARIPPPVWAAAQTSDRSAGNLSPRGRALRILQRRFFRFAVRPVGGPGGSWCGTSGSSRGGSWFGSKGNPRVELPRAGLVGGGRSAPDRRAFRSWSGSFARWECRDLSGRATPRIPAPPWLVQ